MSIYTFDKNDAFDFARFIGITAKPKGDELIFTSCPYCRGTTRKKEKFAINLRTGQFNCFRASCGAKGNMITLSEDFGFELSKDVSAYFNISNYNSKYKKFANANKTIETRDGAVEYLASRGISKAVCEKYEITTKQSEPYKDWIVFPFKDENGELTAAKYRNPFFGNEDNKAPKESSEAGCKPILFGMYQCNFENPTLIITEGQIDALSVSEAGFDNAVSVPNGANGFTWVPYCWDFLHRFKTIIVFGDHEHGKITLLETIRKKLSGSNIAVKNVRPEDYIDCKDANDILRKYGPEQIKKCIENAAPPKINKLVSAGSIGYYSEADIPKLKIGIRAADKILGGGLPFGGLTIVSGKTGEGKTPFCNQIISNALEAGYKCLIYSGEFAKEATMSTIARQLAGTSYISTFESSYGKQYAVKAEAFARIQKWLDQKLYIYDPYEYNDDDPSGSFVEIIRNAIKSYGIQVVLLDNLMTAMFEEGAEGKDFYEKQTQFVNKLTRLALMTGALIIVVAHKKKGQFSENENVYGSSNITNLASVVLSYDRPADKTEETDRRLLGVTKNRYYGTREEGIGIFFEPGTKRMYHDEAEKFGKQSWLEDKEGFIEVKEEDEVIPF